MPRLLYVKTPAPDREPRLAALPTGTVTFLFNDIEGSTRLLQRLGVLAGHLRRRRPGLSQREAVAAAQSRRGAGTRAS